ncbi:hypothetical protein CIRG_01774 [Coccidioides immitis RMSCC 2394]|uniref:HTH psq-type domain-containing protein n=1 Tax=Coccidioides immitis RMSCC 2394 TaxID=404692 RepID=A0A0J6Y1R0_COCIT|nr:hypothetical protein CIRG_01774 [Coccidioides immitis RMSCC 2394]
MKIVEKKTRQRRRDIKEVGGEGRTKTPGVYYSIVEYQSGDTTATQGARNKGRKEPKQRPLTGQRKGFARVSKDNFFNFLNHPLQRVRMPPIRNKNARPSIEIEGRIELAISTLKKQEISSIAEAARLFNVPYTTLYHRANY